MEKFKEKKSVIICNQIGAFTTLVFLLSVFISIFYPKALFGMFSLLVGLPLAIYVKIVSDKEKYTSTFIDYMELKINNAKTLEEFKEIYKEFDYLAIEDDRYALSFPNDLKSLQSKIINSIKILEKLK